MFVTALNSVLDSLNKCKLNVSGRQWFHNEELYRFIATQRKDLMRCLRLTQKHNIPRRTGKPLWEHPNSQGRRVWMENPNFLKQMQQSATSGRRRQKPPDPQFGEAEVAVVFLLFNFTPPCTAYLLTRQQPTRRTCGSFAFAEEVPTGGGRLVVVLGASRWTFRPSRNWRRRRLFWHRISGNDIVDRAHDNKCPDATSHR